MNAVLLFATFSALAIAGLLKDDLRQTTLKRSKEDWIADFAGLFIQGIVIPSFPFLLVPLLANLLPHYDRRWELNSLIQFLLSFVVVDYIYYWNHRCFHGRSFWHLHRLHHSSGHLDVFATSRNSFITSFLFIYLWIQVAAMFLLKDCDAFLFGLMLTFALDLWRHSGMTVPASMKLTLGMVLILPEQHVLHHSLRGKNRNFGANFCWWDRLHGTYSSEEVRNKNLEKISGKSVWKELLLPSKAGK